MRGRILVFILCAAGAASAHIALKSPTARTNDQVQLKVGPCGQNVNMRTNNLTVFKPGQTITVAWDETINHPGHFRISFDPNGTNFPNPTSFTDFNSGATDLVDNIADKTGTAPIAYTQQVTLPNVECTQCTLQLIQVMTDKPPYGDGNDIYYQCADLILTNGDAGIPPDSGVMQDGGVPSSDGGGTGPSDGGKPGGENGDFQYGPSRSCSIAAENWGAGAMWTALLALFLVRRKR